MFVIILNIKEVWNKIIDYRNVKNFELRNKLLYMINIYCGISICIDIDVFLCWKLLIFY